MHYPKQPSKLQSGLPPRPQLTAAADCRENDRESASSSVTWWRRGAPRAKSERVRARHAGRWCRRPASRRERSGNSAVHGYTQTDKSRTHTQAGARSSCATMGTAAATTYVDDREVEVGDRDWVVMRPIIRHSKALGQTCPDKQCNYTDQ
jgi:hypothetical protein